MVSRMVVLDTETTGLDPAYGHRLTEIGCLELIGRRPTGRYFQTYLNPERELDEGAARVTGLSYAFLKKKPKFSDILADFWAFLFPDPSTKTELIIHNAPFDLKFINSELVRCRHHSTVLEQHASIIDTLVLARKLFPGHRTYNLDALCQRHGINNSHRDKHGALLDAEILTEVYLKMTAGQETLLFSGEPLVANPKNKPDTKSKTPTQLHRPKLKVIFANADSVRLHEARLAEINS